MLRSLSLALALFAAVPAFAAPAAVLPGLADVADVAANDVLNVRAKPDAKSEIVTTLAPNAKGVEVLGFDPTGKWAKVSISESTGWASGRFLRLRKDLWPADGVPASLICSGTEPFWSLRRTPAGMEFSSPDSPVQRLELRKVMARGIDGDATRGLIAGNSEGRVTAVIQPEICSDGMSDRSFGLSATLILDGSAKSAQMLSGCCSVVPR
ncbi:COG3650 family protein [Paracoccus aminophilus]|uniref:SH3b domain-containing protein n=1 Tax=Paracoccus aminophilus JCM 7686 TaxID=1367847 RepID=S5Y7M2_PARAH|nr:SH3 domain-containing protein [Paracoccus aminophilus]AGT07343.1 hypothetical protein JCM7686_0232 [Paracoccus aminophilus JCM 7686]